MTPESRLGQILEALEGVQLSCLVMGGHAVRFYGYARITSDFDLALARDEIGRPAEAAAARHRLAGVAPRPVELR